MARTLPWNLTRAALRASTVRDTLNALSDQNAFDVSLLQDDFHGPVLDANKWTVGNGGGGGSPASAVVSAGLKNGAVIMVTGTAGDGTADSFLSSGRHFTGDSNAVMIARLKVTAITSVKIEVGLTDSIASAATHTVNSKSGPSYIATEGVCWIFDTADTGRGWDGMGVAAVATRMTAYNVSPVADTYEYLQVALQDGVAYFSHFTTAGVRDFGPSALASAVTKTVLLAPYVSCEGRNGTSKTVTVDWICAYQGRTTD